ncbi:Hypothetical predicted protein [Mytilus galloprovincialis]|uniref:B box-type domain-containing protein n=1 Tax=Mytilus galloprovincialis TaxID=29158 RepID=A0A8B6BXK7_MYTGA|nr:Hypothetical predicted protein [Mytilus galloprovincialis]
MALSRSIQKAQIPLPCELSEIEMKIQWKCTECNLLMCDKCKIYGHNSEQMFDFSEMQCPDHSEQVCCLFCYSCGCLVCPTGVTEVHKMHELVEIEEEAFRMRKEFLKIMKDKLKKQHEDWIKNNDLINTLKETNNLRFEQTKKDILKQKQIWKEAADEYATELCDEINKQWRLKEDAIKTESSKVKYFEQHLTNKIQLIEDMSISMDVKKFFEDTKSFDNVTEMPNLNLNESQLTSFVPGDINVSLFGTIENEIKKDKIIRIEAIKEYTTELGIVTQIVPCSENKLWIHESYPDRLQKISLQNYSSIKVLLQINKYVLRTVLTRNGDLLISDQTSNLKILKRNEDDLRNSIYNFTPYTTTAIHINGENKLIVGAIKKLHRDYSEPGGGVVMVVNMDGNYEAKYKLENNNEHLFTDPKDITSTNNGNIFIVDRIADDWRGRVVMLQKGIVGNIYTGHTDINSKNHPFKPCNVVATPNDNVIVSDMINNTLHFLDNLGHLLGYCNTVEDDILLPNSMLCSKPGKLFIGSSTQEIGEHKAKIYEVDMPNHL